MQGVLHLPFQIWPLLENRQLGGTMLQIWVAEIHEKSKISKDKQRESLDKYWGLHVNQDQLQQSAPSQLEKVSARRQL